MIDSDFERSIRGESRDGGENVGVWCQNLRMTEYNIFWQFGIVLEEKAQLLGPKLISVQAFMA